MFICMDTDWTCAVGTTPEEAYQKYLEDNEGSEPTYSPESLRWFAAIEHKAKITTEPLPKPPTAKAKK